MDCFMKPSPHSGFSLAELSAVLVIIAIILGSSLSVYLGQTDNVKQQQTHQKITTIERSLAAFVTIHGRLPCPAAQALTQTNSNAGREYCPGTSTKDLSGTLPSGFSSSYTDNLVLIGAVPTKTLQLSDEFMVDGWGNRFDYAVTAALAASLGTYDAPATLYHLRNTNMGIITVQDASGTNRTNQAAFVLVSHGKNGLGAWQKNGVKNSNPTDIGELQNAISAGNIAGTLAFRQQEALPSTLLPYDDIVSYQMKWQLVRNAGFTFSEPACSTAESILYTDASLVNGLYYSGICGVAPGNSNCALYLHSLATQISRWCL